MTSVNLMKEKSLRKKVYFTIFVLAVASLLTQIPIVGANTNYLSFLFRGTSVLQFMDAVSGGALGHLSFASFGITTYITATLIVQLMTVIFPSIEKIRKDGERGRKNLERIQFLLAMMITFIGSLTLSLSYGRLGLFQTYDMFHVTLAVISWMAGSFIIISLAQKVSTYGIGNGITLVLGFNILSRIPGNISVFYKEHVLNNSSHRQLVYIIGLTVGIIIFYFIGVFLQCGMLKISIKQTKKGAAVVNSDGYIPMHVNVANILPVIYASTIMTLPALFCTLSGIQPEGKVQKILSVLSAANWYSLSEWYHLIGLAVYITLILIFGMFASSLSFNSAEIANNMRKNGDTIPYVKPGEDTVKYLERRRKILSVVNVAFLIVLTMVPDFICHRADIDISFMGTSLVIVVSMLFDTAIHLRAASIHNDKAFAIFGEKRKEQLR